MQRATLHIKQAFRSRSSRPSGKKAHAAVLIMLSENESVALDFEQAQMTPSFADELVGGLLATLGKNEFFQRVVLSGMSEDTGELVRHIIARRNRDVTRHPLESVN